MKTNVKNEHAITSAMGWLDQLREDGYAEPVSETAGEPATPGGPPARRDRLAAGRRRDRLAAGRGRDRLAAGRGRDRPAAGRGRDRPAAGHRDRQA